MITRLSVALLVWMALLNGAVAQTVGRTPGNFNVSAIGSAQYSIPIWAPPGPRGMQPNISLSYDSGSGIGPLGIGWSLGGLGSITRCNLTVAQDTTAAPVALVAGDGYCMNGKRLRLTSGTYGAASSTYQTEVADFSNVTAYGTSGITGISYFMVQARNGLTYYYGFVDGNSNGTNSQALANGTTTVLTWFLSKVVDRAQNNYVINYLPASSGTLTGTSVPYKILWTPASAGASTYTYTMLFNYTTTNPPQSSINEYVAGTLVTNTELLGSIEILLSGTVVKDYILTYQPSSITGREQLTTVTECTDSSKSNCLLPTTVGYASGTMGVSSTSNTAVSSSGAFVTARYDFNGDGYPDIVYNPTGNGTWYVAFGSASGYGTPVSTGITGSIALFGKLNGGSQDQILANYQGTLYAYSWNGTQFVGTTTGIAYDSSTYGYQLADINGDGLPDLVDMDVTTVSYMGHSNTTLTIYTRQNTTTAGGAVSFSSTATTAYSQSSIAGAQLQTPDSQHGKLRRFDFNGDGRDDLAIEIITGTSPNYTYNTYEMLSTGTTFTPLLISSVAASAFHPVFYTNWNDDACTDFVSLGTLYVSSCNGSVSVSHPISGTVIGAMDWDGDGRTDLLVSNGSTIGVYLSQATGMPTETTTSIPYSSNCTYVWMDANGDGLDDLGCWSSASGEPITYYLHNGTSDLATAFTDGFGNSASPTYIPLSEGNYTEHGYGEATLPDADYIGPMYVVSNVNFSDPSAAPGTAYSQSFQYYGAWMNLQGRGFDGFAATYFLDSRNNVGHSRYYERAFPYTGMLYNDVRQVGSQFLTGAVGTPGLTTLSTATNQQRYFPFFSNWTLSQYEIGYPSSGNPVTTTSTNYTFDSYGNATNIVKTVTDNDPGSPYTGDTWTTTTTNTTDISNPTYTAGDLAAWCLTMLDETQVVYSSMINGSNTITRTKTFGRDTPTNCRILSSATGSGLYAATETLTYDSFGNIATDTMTGANMPSSPASRLTTLNWGTTGQFLSTVTDPSNAVSTLTYGSNQALTFGVPDSVKNPNNLTTSWTYDAYGRKNKEIRPDSTSTTWTWSTCTSFCGWSNSVYEIAQSNYQTNGSTIIRTDTNFYDPIDRVTETSGPTVTGSTGLVQRLYNSLGLLTQQSLPRISGATAYQQTYSYDVLNRPLSVSRPISSTNSTLQSTSYAYAGRKFTVTDPYGNAKTMIQDVKGSLRQAKDAIGYNIIRAFDAAESLTGVTDSVGNTLLSGVTYVYGLKPFRLAATDADRGAWTYTVDSLGERTGWKDAKNQSFTMTYDALSRPLTRSEPDLFTQWAYGSTPASYNVGQLISECTGTTGSPPTSCGSTPIYQETRAFDSFGRLWKRAISESTNPGHDPGGVYLFTSTYSTATGLPSTLTYPISTSGVAALNIQYGFQNGLLQTVTDTTDTTTTCGSTCTLWTANTMNAFGEITEETLGNGVVTNRSYDAVTSWLSGATAGVGGGATLLNQSYLEDENGNIIQRQNNNLGLTESFAYDADQRLTCVALSSTCSTATLAYDGGAAGPGNITSQTGVGSYTYPAAGQPRPHGVTSLTGTFNGISNPSFVYDANGNMTNRASTSANISWTSFNYPMSISATDATGSETVAINYGPDRQRVQQNYTGPSGTETTFYIGGLMDIVVSGSTTDNRHYIYAGREPIAVYSRKSSGVNTMSYMIEDHQSGISDIASNSGASDVNESFSAFGTRRNPTTWSGAPTTADLNTIAGLSRQGYTMQTWLGQSMGLNHMNGRVEDAILGRFLSPDPHVPDRSNAQSYNRYSYVNNNPLSMVDPSGFAGHCLVLATCPNDVYFGGASGGGWGFGGGDGDADDDLFGPSDTTALTNWVNGVSAATSGAIADALSIYNTASASAAISENLAGSMAVSANVGQAQSQDPSGQSAGTAQSQNQALSQPSSDGLQEIVVTATQLSNAAGWTGAAALIADPASGTWSIGTNMLLYRTASGNQYFRTLARVSTVFKSIGAGAVLVGTVADYFDAIDTGSFFQANLNAGIGGAGLFTPVFAPIYAIPGSIYFVVSTNYPGGPPAYNAAFSEALNAAGPLY